MATLTIQDISRSGLTPSFAAAGVAGDEFSNDGMTYIEVINGDAGAHVVTIATQLTDDGLAVADRTVSVGAGVRKKIGPFQKSIYNDANGKVQITYDGVTNVTIGVFRHTPATS
jgi:hypothetical protein